jgi:ribosomal protein S18 acetylase RimI-like enzyme
MELRKATVRDIDSIVKLVTAMLQDMAVTGGYALNEERHVHSQLRDNITDSLQKRDRVVLMAVPEAAEEPVGMIEASVTSLPGVFWPRSVLHIHSVYVEPRHRGQGMGRRLLEAALEWGREKGCAEAELNVLARNPARGLYESAGFEVFELKMRLELSTSGEGGP